MKVKDIFSKLLISILIVLILSNSILSTPAYASTLGELADAADDLINDFISATLGTIVGLFINPFATVAEALAFAADGLIAGIAYSQGSIDENGNIDVHDRPMSITPFDIFFNKVALLDVNFFNIPNDDSMISNIRISIAGWYYVMRNLAAAILLCVLIYVGIRMAITTIASDKASYKKMLVDWICSLALIFLIQYIIIFTLEVNSAFIRALSGVSEGEELQKAIIEIKKTSADWSLNGIAATVVYCMLVGQTLGLVITYFNRMLKIAFLIIISPLITLTYSIDKMGDGKAQALGTWLKEFVFSVLIQTFHCVIYMAFISMAATLLNDPVGFADNNNLAGAIISMLCIKFTKDAEKILGKIFKFSDSTSDTSLAVGMAASAMALSKAKSFGKGTRKAINGIGNIKNNVSNFARTAKIEGLALMSLRKGKTSSETGDKMTYEEAKEAAEAKVDEAAAKKIKEKYENHKKFGKYFVQTSESAYQNRVNEEVKKLMNTGNMTESLAKAKARENVAKELRKSARKENFYEKHKNLKSARGTVDAVRDVYRIARNTETAAVLRDIKNTVIGGGAGLFAGGATYGATGNEFNSIALGIATGKSTKEFFGASTSNLKNIALEHARSISQMSGEDTETVMQDVVDMAGILGDNSELNDYLNNPLSKIEEAMGGPSADSNIVKNSIKSIVSKEVKKTPGVGTDALMKKVLESQSVNDAMAAHRGVFTKDLLKNCVENVGQIYHKKELFDTIQSASNIGVDSKSFIKSVTKSSNKSSFVNNAQIIHNVTTGNVELGETLEPKALSRSDAWEQRQARDGDISKLRTDVGNVREDIEIDIKEKAGRTITVAEFAEMKIEVEQSRALAETEQHINDTELEAKARSLEKTFEEVKAEFKREYDELGAVATQKQLKALLDKFNNEMKKITDDYTATMNQIAAKEKIKTSKMVPGGPLGEKREEDELTYYSADQIRDFTNSEKRITRDAQGLKKQIASRIRTS